MDQFNKRAVPTQQTHLANKVEENTQTQRGLTVQPTTRPVTRLVAQSRPLQNPITQHEPHQVLQQQQQAQQQAQQQLQQLHQQQQQQQQIQKLQQNGKYTKYQRLFISNANDPQYVHEYCEDIHIALLTAEQSYLVTSDYMLSQSNITAKYREVLIDWLSSVRGKYRLKIDTFALCISILDRFLERREITKDKLQLVGCTALWIASKYEEIYPPELEDLVMVSDKNFSREQFIMMERIILTILEFRVTVPYAHHFAERFIAALPDSQYDKVLVQNMTLYIIESSYQNYSFVGHLPSQIATAAVSLALFSLTPTDHFPTTLTDASGYVYQDIRELFEQLWQCVSAMRQQHLLKREQQQQGIRPAKVFDSVYRLYMTDVWSFSPQLIADYVENGCPN